MSTPRPTCLSCRRPATHCWCRLVEPVETRTRIVFLQHLRESRVRVGTARIAHLALPNSEFHVGTSFSLTPGPRTAVLFPGDDALGPELLAEGDPWTLVVVDGTWSQARKLVQRDPVLRALPRVGFRPERPGNYRIRREPSAECLATVEAVAQVLAQVEGSPARFDSMIAAFTHMVDLQIEAASGARSSARRREKTGPERVDERLARLQRAGDRLVLFHAEANSHPRSANVPGQAELVHLVALRPATGERFEAVVVPRRPLAPDAPRRLGLEPELLLGGQDPASALGEFRAFLRDEDVLASWGRFPLELLAAEGMRPDDPLDLRALLAKRLGRKPGAFEGLHGPLPPESAPGLGRAGKTVASLEAIARSLAA